jgi:uncharacterized protein YtpQ (UPF0354 family)
MNSEEIRLAVEQEGRIREWQTRWNKEKDVIEIYFDPGHKPFLISIPRVADRIRVKQADPKHVIADLIRQIEIVAETARVRTTVTLSGKDRSVYPVMRSTSFPTETSEGKKLIYDPHTAESRVYYALDLGKSYTLIDQDMLNRSEWTEQELKERALFNLRSLKQEAKPDTVADNRFYFISPKDGYGASRILNQSLIEDYANKAKGELCLAIPHQDVLVVADIVNEKGYDVLQQLTLSFYRLGDIPITMLPFQYQNGQLEPIFILAKRKAGSDSHES